MEIISSDDDDNNLLTRLRTKEKTVVPKKPLAKVGPTNVVDESSDDDEALLQRHNKRIAGVKAPAGRQPRPSLGQQQSGAIPATKAVAKTQEPEARQSFRGQLAFNPLRVSAAQPKPESDSEEEQWQRIKATALKPATASTRKLSAVASPTVTVPAPAQDRRLSLTKGTASSTTAKPADLHESDSDEEQWQRVKKMVKERPKQLPVRAGLAAPSGRLSIRASPGAVPINPNAQLEGAGERWARGKASRTTAVAAGTARSGGAVVGQRKRGDKPDASDSDEEQWQRVKAQVSAARAPPAAGPLPRESRTAIREGQARVTQDMLPGRQRRSASMHVSPIGESGPHPAAARRASVPTSRPSTDAATVFQAEPAARSSFVGGGMSFRRTMDVHVQPPIDSSPYQPAAMRVTGTLPDEQGFVTGERYPHPQTVRRPSRAMPDYEAPHQPARTATYAVSSIALGAPQESLHQVDVYEALASRKQSLLAPHMQENFANDQTHEESIAQQSMPAYPAQLPAGRRDTLAPAQSQQFVTGNEQVQAGRRESIAAPELHQGFVSNERMYEEMPTVHTVPLSPQMLASRRESVASAVVPQARQNIGVNERMENDVNAVQHNQLEPQPQVQTSRRQSMTAPHVQQSLGNPEQTQAGSRGSFAAAQLQQSFPNSEHMQNRREEIAAPQVQPQPRQSRLSWAAQPQGELLQTKAASLPPLAARTSHAAVRRASAPTNAPPDIPETPAAALGPSPAGMLFSKRRSSAGPSLSRSSSGTAAQLQPNTPQQQREPSRRSSLAPAATDAYEQPLQRFNEVPPQNPDTFDPTAFSAAYGITVGDHESDMKQDHAAAQQRSSGQQELFTPQIAHPASSSPDLHQHLPPVHQPANLGAAVGGAQVGSRGSLSRAGNSFSFSGGSADAEHHQYEPAQLPSALPHGAPVSALHEPAPRRVTTLSEGGKSLGGATLRSEPTLSPAAYTDMLQEGSALHLQPIIQEAPTRDQEAEGHASQLGRRASNMSSNGASRGYAQAQAEADMHHLLQSPSPVLDGAQRPATQEETGGVVPDNSPFEREQQQQHNYPEGRIYSNMAWTPRFSSGGPRASPASDNEDLSSVRAMGAPARSSIDSLPAGSMTVLQTGESATWHGRSAPPGMPPGSPPDETVERGRGPEGREEWGAELQQGAPPPEAFKVYDNQVAASAHAADQLLHSAAQQATQAERGGQAPEGIAMDRESLETVIMQAVQASMSSALTTLSTDVQQLNVKCGQWWQRSEDMCTSLQQEIGQLRRGTANDISAISARLALIEAQKSKASVQPEPREAQQPAAQMASDCDQTFAEDIIKRLDSLEARVACQLDQLTSAHHKRITAIKGNLHASVAEAAAAAQSRPGSPTKGSNVTSAAELPPPTPRPEPQVVGKGSGEAPDSDDAASKNDCPKEAQPTATNGHGYASYKELAKKVDKLEASHRILAAADRCKAELAVTDAVAAAALDKRLCAMEERLHSVHAEAADAGSAAHGAQQRIAAAEWRIEKVATACAATVKALTTRQERTANSLSLVKGTASLADAKCAALGAEVAKLYRDSGLKRAASPCDRKAHRIPRPPTLADGGQHAGMCS
ncbi:hypothetical protein COCOBI_05-2260 [Coccomyxa sp. Obi]|nr:hypothetical protein COCOBI_05-2260 [Coccomyxa sp. Obi]